MTNEEKAVVMPIIAKLYRFRQEEDIDNLADALELFAEENPEELTEAGEPEEFAAEESAEESAEDFEEPEESSEEDEAEESAEDLEEPEDSPEEDEAGESEPEESPLLDGMTIQRLADAITEQAISRISETMGTPTRGTEEAARLESLLARLEKAADQIDMKQTSAPEISASESAPLPETSAHENADGADVSYSSMQKKVAEAMCGMTESQQEALLSLIEGGERLSQACKLILLDVDELSDKSEDYKALMRVHETLTGIIRRRENRNGNQVDKFNTKYSGGRR